MTESNVKVVFVCEHGAAKSVVAQALFNQMAGELGLSACAIARGTSPDAAVQPGVSEGLRRDAVELGDFKPERFMPADLDNAAMVVSFDQPAVAHAADGRVAVQAWDGLPLMSADYGIARDSIRDRVRALVESLARAEGS